MTFTRANDPLLTAEVAHHMREIRASLALIEQLLRNAEGFRKADFRGHLREVALLLQNAEESATKYAVSKTRAA